MCSWNLFVLDLMRRFFSAMSKFLRHMQCVRLKNLGATGGKSAAKASAGKVSRVHKIKRAIRSHASTYCKGPNDSAVPPFLVPAKMLRQMTFYLCRNPLVYPLTQEIRCIYHTELQGRLGHAFVRNFHQCSSLCNGLSDLMIPFNAIFMEFHRSSLIYVISFRFYARTGFLSMGHKTVTTVYHS